MPGNISFRHKSIHGLRFRLRGCGLNSCAAPTQFGFQLSSPRSQPPVRQFDGQANQTSPVRRGRFERDTVAAYR